MNSDSGIAFAPNGNTVILNVGVVSTESVQAPINTTPSLQNAGQYLITNTGLTVVFLSYGANSAEAIARAVIPTTGVPSSVIPLLQGSAQVLRFQAGTFFGGISTAAAAVYITPGQGL